MASSAQTHLYRLAFYLITLTNILFLSTMSLLSSSAVNFNSFFPLSGPFVVLLEHSDSLEE